MSAPGKQRVDSILESLTCPQCRYSLRGLVGEFVTCPECGQRVNVQAYVAAQWRGAWFNAPLYNTLAFPLAWMSLSAITTLIVASNSRSGGASLILIAGMAIVVAGWIPLLGYVTRRFGSIEGLWLALLVHFTLPGYLVGLAMCVGGLVAFLSSVDRRAPIPFGSAMISLAGAAAFAIAFLIERFVARRCIRRHLRLSAGSGSGPEQRDPGRNVEPRMEADDH